MIHSVNSVNPGHSDSDNYGFRIDMSPGTTVCSNLASETGPYPNTSVNASMQIGDPFEFHGNCAPSTFKLNTMNNSTARGLYMGGMPIGSGSSNGVIIGDQLDVQMISPFIFSFASRDNYWTNILNGSFHTDYNNVDGTLNEFWMTYSTAGFNNNFQAIVNGFPSLIPQYSFQSILFNNPTTTCPDPFVSPAINPINLDVFDDIALDSILKLGGNDTSRYFGKEYLYSQMKMDSTLYNNAILSLFKDSMENSNAKGFYALKEKMVFPMDSVMVDSLRDVLSVSIPENNIEEKYVEVFDLALKNPELKDSVFSNAEMEKLKSIARLCPYMDGTAVYTARVILHHFEPEVNYYHYCEFAKRPDRQNAERLAKESEKITQPGANVLTSNFVLIPNPNNGRFKLICSKEENIHLLIFDSKGGQIFEKDVFSENKVVDFDVLNQSAGIYNLTVISSTERKNIRFVINK
jgi:hypothetical protein